MASLRVRARQFAKAEPPLVAAADWRLQAATWMTKPAVVNGHEYAAGTLVSIHGQARTSAEDPIIDFGVPSVTALLLDHAARLDIAYQDFSARRLPAGPNMNLRNFELFELFESRMASVVFAHSALEAFANEMISRAYAGSYRYEPVVKNGVSVSYDLESVERKLTLEEKLAKVIPNILSIPSPKGKRPWNKFQKLKKLRDRVVHCKARDRAASKPDDDVLWRALLEPAARTLAFDAYNLMGYFYRAKPTEMPRWFANWPYNEPL